MRKIIASTLTALCVCACAGVSEKAARKAIEEVITDYLECPSTYAFVSMEETGVRTAGEEVANVHKRLSDLLEKNKLEMRVFESSISVGEFLGSSTEKYRADLESRQEFGALIEKLLNNVDSLHASMGADTAKVVGTIYKIEYDAQNTNGALVRRNARATVSNDGRVMSIYTSDHYYREFIESVYPPLLEVMSNR